MIIDEPHPPIDQLSRNREWKSNAPVREHDGWLGKLQQEVPAFNGQVGIEIETTQRNDSACWDPKRMELV